MLDARNLGFDPRAYEVTQFVAGDFGQSAPTVAFAACKLYAPQGRFPRGSIILVDEWNSADPEDLSVGIPTSPGRIADAVKAMCDRNFGPGRGRRGVFDNSRGLGVDETLLKFFQTQGLYLALPPKSHVQGWATLRELCTNSQERNGKPGFWATDRCAGFWATAPSIPRDERNPEDVDSRSVDHWLDAARYAAVAEIWLPRDRTPEELVRMRAGEPS
jgi:hypothetical protein